MSSYRIAQHYNFINEERMRLETDPPCIFVCQALHARTVYHRHQHAAVSRCAAAHPMDHQDPGRGSQRPKRISGLAELYR